MTDPLDFTSPPALIREAVDLDAISDAIKESYIRAKDHERKEAQEYAYTGHKLLAAKAAVGHGNWLSWVEKNCPFSRSHAARCIKLAQWEEANVASALHLAEQWKIICGRKDDDEQPSATSPTPPTSPTGVFCRHCRINGPVPKCKDCKAVRRELSDEDDPEEDQGGREDSKKGKRSTNGTEIPLNKWNSGFGNWVRLPDEIVKVLPEEASRTEYHGLCRLRDEAGALWTKWMKRLSKNQE